MVVGSFLQEVVHDRYRGRDGRLCRFSRACRKPESPASRSALTAAATAVLLRNALASMPLVPRSRASMSPFWKTKQATRIVTVRSEEQKSELQSIMSKSYAVFCLKKKNNKILQHRIRA